MKNYKILFILGVMLVAAASFVQPAFAAKTLEIGTAQVNNTGTEDTRTVTLDVTLKGGADDVNGLVFSLNYNPENFTFKGLVTGDMPIDDGSTYDPENPPAAETIGSTLYYQANNKASQGIVLIAAAAANFFTTDPAADFVPFKVKFMVKAGMGNATYPISIQKTIIGPDTALNAGYTEPTELAVAAGLAPDADPVNAQTYDVGFKPGYIQVDGGYDVTGTVVLGATPEINADGALARLVKVESEGEFNVDEQIVSAGAFKFTSVSNGQYKVRVISSALNYQKKYTSAEFTVSGDNFAVPKITLAEYKSVSGKLTVKGVTGLKGLQVEVRDAKGNVVAVADVDADGNYVTPALPTGVTYTYYAVYGTAEQEFTGADYTWDLALGTVSGTIDSLCDGQQVELLIASIGQKLKKGVMVTGTGVPVDFTIEHLLPGTDYKLSMTGDGVGPIYYNNTENFSDAADVAVTAGADTPDNDFTFSCADIVTISGTVTVNGTKTKGVVVKANNFNFNDYKFGSATTDSEGAFTIQAAKSDDYYVFAKYGNKNYYYKGGVTLRSDATVVDASAGSKTGIDIAIATTGADTAMLQGYVTKNLSKEDGGIALSNYLVALETANGELLPFTARTNDDGLYSFENMAAGTYNVVLYPAAPYIVQKKKGVVLTNDNTTEVDFIVAQHFTISGDVLQAADGTSPIPGAGVGIRNSLGQNVRQPVYTNTAGEYTLVEIPSGVYILEASHSDYVPDGPAETEGGKTTVLTDLTEVDFLLTQGAALSGTVSDSVGGVSGALVTMAGPNNVVKSTKTNGSGEYEFKGLAVGTYIIKARKGTIYQPYEPEDVDIVAGANNHDITLVKPDTVWTFGGTVQDSGNKGISGAYVLLSSVTTKYAKVVLTNNSGGFSFTNVIDGGDYELLVLPGGDMPFITETVGEIKADKKDYTVTIPTFEVISGKVTLSEADADAVIIVGAYDSVNDDLFQVKAEDSGDNTVFTYSIKVKPGIGYKVFAQDLSLGFTTKFWASGGSVAYDAAEDVTNTSENIDINLTK